MTMPALVAPFPVAAAAMGLAAALSASAAASAAVDAPAPPGAAAAAPAHLWRATLELGTTAVATNNIIPAPIAIGAGVLIERDKFGLGAAVHVDGASICDQGEQGCGAIVIADAVARFTPFAGAALSPYVAARLQLVHDDRDGLVPAAGPRLGLRYRASVFGFYVEAGPSFVSAEDSGIGRLVIHHRWFPQASAGLTVALW
jgi:hypothetical protein